MLTPFGLTPFFSFNECEEPRSQCTFSSEVLIQAQKCYEVAVAAASQRNSVRLIVDDKLVNRNSCLRHLKMASASCNALECRGKLY